MKSNHRELRSGPLKLRLELDSDGCLRDVVLPKKVPDGLEPTHLASALADLAEYTLALDGPPFRCQVWERMLEIPWGSALTYGELAKAVGKPGATRAVGTACATNRLPLVIPCHRVLAETGLGGFAYGIAWKAKLLELETEPQR